MRIAYMLVALAFVFLLADCSRLPALEYGGTTQPGMFGPRVFGQSIGPRPSVFGDRIVRGSAGQFIGIGRPGMEMFGTQWMHTLSPAPATNYAPGVYLLGPLPQVTTPLPQR